MLNNPGNGINGDGLQGATIENNLIVGFTKYGVSIYTEDAGVPSSGNEIINNTIVGPNSYELQNGATGIVSFNNIILASAPQVDSTSSLKTSNNITTGTPASLFVSPATGNYQLLAGASAIGAGVATFSGDSAPSTDILGTSRNGRFDCGAYEYGATVTPPPPPPPPTPVVTLTGSPNDLVSAVYTLSITAQDTGNPIASYAITWGDGSPVQTVLASPDVVSGGVATSTTTAQHTYATFGTYKISAVATDVSGTVAAGGPSVNVTAVVVPPPPPPPPSPLTITINSASGSGSNANVSLTITGSGAAALLAAL
jgi:hypothetical protein